MKRSAVYITMIIWQPERKIVSVTVIKYTKCSIKYCYDKCEKQHHTLPPLLELIIVEF